VQDKLRVALYTRVSTEDQAREGFSLQVQRDCLLQYAKNFGWEVFCSVPGVEVYEDDGYSGSTMDRPAFQILRNDAHNKKFDLLLIYKQDRLSRNLKELLTFLEELGDWGIGFKSATEPFDTTSSAGKLAIQMLGSYAEFERNRLIERVFPGMIMGVKKGHWQGARYFPFGYKHNKSLKRLEVVPEEAEIVKEIYRMYISGYGTKKIAQHFHYKGIKSREGHSFYTKLIRDILRSKTYLGMMVWNKKHYDKKQKTESGKGYKYVRNDPSKVIEVPNTHEAIITQTEFDRAQELLDRNRKTKVIRFRDTIYHLSGVVFCKRCGLTYRGNMLSVNSRTKEKRAWYRCSSISRVDRQCNNKGITANVLEKEVWAILEVIIKNIHIFENLKEAIKLAKSEPEEHYFSLLKELELKLASNLEKQKGLYQVYKEDKINLELYKQEAEKLRAEEKKLEVEIRHTQIKILEQQDSVDNTLRVHAFLSRLVASANQKVLKDSDIKEFVRIVFKRIEVDDQKMVNFELNQPWKLCYEQGIKECQEKQGKEARKEDQACQNRRSYVVFCKHSAARWFTYGQRIILGMMAFFSK